jgi:hypothetical protein
MKLLKYKAGLKYLIFIVIGTICSCSNPSGSSNQSTMNDSLSNGSDTKKMESVYYRFPTPDEIFGFINNEQLKFDPTLLNPEQNVEKYLESKTQTLALGIYVADLAYITIFESFNKSIEYYKIIHTLSDKVRITSAYDLSVAKRIEKNLLNIDSLKNISVDSYSSMVEYLIVNNREKTLALLAAGAYIECFYISFNMAGAYNAANPMIVKIVDLKYAFENLYSYLQIYSEDKSVKEVAEQLNGLNTLFSKLKEVNIGKTKVKQEASGNIVISGGNKLQIDKELFEQMRTEVFKLRKEMTSNK